MKRAWVISVFLDLRGFKSWLRKTANAPEIRHPFMKRFFSITEQFVSKNQCEIKRLGDGVMFLFPIKNKSMRKPYGNKLIVDICRLYEDFNHFIETCEWPPEGLRIRVCAGYCDVYRCKSFCDPNKFVDEFISESINLCEQSLNIRPEVPVVVCPVFYRSLGGKDSHWIETKKLIVKERFDDIDDDFYEGLREVNLKNNGKIN